jgi:hypothetical protein
MLMRDKEIYDDEKSTKRAPWIQKRLVFSRRDSFVVLSVVMI